MTEQVRMRILELLRHQIPDPNLAVQDNPVTVLLLDLLDRVTALEVEVFEEVEELSS